MARLINGDDGLPAEEVGVQAKEKHQHLCSYIDISRGARSKYIGNGPGKGGATYIDLFCGAGRGRVRETGEWIDGSAIAAWKKSRDTASPFTNMYINDSDPERLRGTVARLRSLGAPVVEHCDQADVSAEHIVSSLNPYGLHFAFVDTYNLESLDFSIFRSLSKMKRMDILVHLSKMDLQRNLGKNLSEEERAFDAFAPGWRSVVDINQAHAGIRSELIDHWRSLITQLEFEQPAEEKLIRASGNQPLYWLLLVAKHELAQKFWKTVAKGKQGSLF